MYSQERTYFQRYMAFTKKAVFIFLVISAFGYSLQGLDSLGIHLATWPLLIQWVVLFVMTGSAHRFYNRYYQPFSQLYDKVQNKVSNWVLDYVFNIHHH